MHLYQHHPKDIRDIGGDGLVYCPPKTELHASKQHHFRGIIDMTEATVLIKRAPL